MSNALRVAVVDTREAAPDRYVVESGAVSDPGWSAPVDLGDNCESFDLQAIDEDMEVKLTSWDGVEGAAIWVAADSEIGLPFKIRSFRHKTYVGGTVGTFQLLGWRKNG